MAVSPIRIRRLVAGFLATALWAPLLLPIGLAGCRSRSTGEPLAPPNVFVVVIDTLRADRVGWYGGGVTDFLDTMAQHGSVFWNAYSPSSWTSPVVASLFTSRFPSQHGVAAYSSVLGAAERTLAEELQAAGYATLGLTANILVNANQGYGQGFDRYQTYLGPIKERAPTLARDALEWIDRTRAEPRSKPLFVYLQLMEAHEPWQPSPAAIARLAARRGFDDARVAKLTALARDQPPLILMSAEEIDLARDLYDAEIGSADAELRDFFAALAQRGLLENSLVIVTADHGEEFHEHGRLGHGHTLYNEVIHVPLLIALPGQRARVDVRDVVSLIDLAPTVLATAGVAAPDTFEGRSQLPMLQRGPLLRWLYAGFGRLKAPTSAYSEMGDFRATDEQPKLHARALVVGAHKLIERRDDRHEGYDLAADPGEHQADGLSAEIDAALHADIGRLQQRLERNPSAARTQSVDADTRERMRALGYDERP
ncbi:MAG: sulfatase [bacterium]